MSRSRDSRSSIVTGFSSTVIAPSSSASTTWLGGVFLSSWLGGGGCGERDVETLLRERRDHHEDDQQDQHHVHQRRDVDIRLGSRVAPSFIAMMRLPIDPRSEDRKTPLTETGPSLLLTGTSCW